MPRLLFKHGIKMPLQASIFTCVITTPTSVPYGMMALKLTAALAMLFFCIYWVLIAL